MISSALRSVRPVAWRSFFKVRPVAAALVLVALMAGGAVAQQAAGGGEAAAATKRLFEAVYDNNLGAVQTSIAAGADISATNEQGLMPVDVAVDRGHFRVAHFLLSIRNFRRTKRAEAAPPPPLPVVPAGPVAKAPPERTTPAAPPPHVLPPPVPWPADRPNPFDPAATAQSANLPLVGPVFGPGTAPPVARAPPQPTVAAPAPAATVEAKPEPQPARPGIFSRLTDLFRPGEGQPAESGAAPPSGTASDVASVAAPDTATQEASVPAKTTPRTSEDQPRPAASRPLFPPPLASRKPSAPPPSSRTPSAPPIPPASTGNPFDPAAAAPGSALPVIGAIQEPVAAPPTPKAAAPTPPAVDETTKPAPPQPSLFQRLVATLKPGRPEAAAEDPSAAPQPEEPQLAETPAQPMRPGQPAASNEATSAVETETKADVAAADESSKDVPAKDMDTAAGAGEPMEKPATGPGFFRRLAEIFEPKEEIPDSARDPDIRRTDQQSALESPSSDPRQSGDWTVDTLEEAKEDARVEQAPVEPPATLLPRSRSEGGRTVASPGTPTTPAPPTATKQRQDSDAPAPSPEDDPTKEAVSVAESPESQADQPSLIQRLTEFFKSKVEPPTDIAETKPTRPAPAPAEALSSPPTEGQGELERELEREVEPEVEIVSLPRPASVEPAAMEPTAMEKEIEVAAAPPSITPAPTPSPEPAADRAQDTVERAPSPGFFERLSRFFRPDEKAPAAGVEPTGPETATEPEPAVESTIAREQPATDPFPARSDGPPAAPPPPSPTETAVIAERPEADAPNLEPPTPAADTPSGETDPFDPAAAPFNLPVIGEIYGPGSALPRPEPRPAVKSAPAPAPPVEVAEAPAAVAAPHKEIPMASEEPAPPATAVSPAETENADESPGFLDRLKGLFRPAAEGSRKTPATSIPPASAPSTPVPPAPKETATAPVAATETATALSETAPPIPEAAGATGEPAKPVGLFQRLADFLIPEADKTLAGDAAATAKDDARAQEGVETARLPARPASSVPIPPPPPRLLEGVILTLGETVRLGKDPGKGMEEAGRRRPCLKKKEGALVFCVGPVDWPGEIEHHFDVSTFMYHGKQAITRYDNGAATSYYTLFKTDAFDAVTAYFERRFGKPTEIWERRVKPMASAPLPNPTMLWRSIDPATQTVSVLEVRRFDDARGGFPDMRHGAILLRREDAQPIFPRLSTLELMSVN